MSLQKKPKVYTDLGTTWTKIDTLQPWNNVKSGECHETFIRGDIRCYVYGGYTQYGIGWHTQVRIDRARPPNKFSVSKTFKKLKDARKAAYLSGLFFLVHCIITETKPDESDLVDLWCASS